MLTEQEIEYFNQLEEESKKNPLAKVFAASEYVSRTLKQAFTTPKGVVGNEWCRALATYTGVAVATTAKEKSILTKLETKGGTFWVGEGINHYLYGSSVSVWELVMFIYKQKHKEGKDIDLHKMIEKTTNNIGDPDARVWDGTSNPYENIQFAKESYSKIKNKLEPYKLNDIDYPCLFAISLGNAILEVENIFPPNINCLEIALETVMFYSHMD